MAERSYAIFWVLCPKQSLHCYRRQNTLAVGVSLLPIGAKPLYAWMTGFWSLGMAKSSHSQHSH
ncbi:MAG: hypothetical protein ACK5C9_19955 [Pseudanabaena sp.]